MYHRRMMQATNTKLKTNTKILLLGVCMMLGACAPRAQDTSAAAHLLPIGGASMRIDSRSSSGLMLSKEDRLVSLGNHPEARQLDGLLRQAMEIDGSKSIEIILIPTGSLVGRDATLQPPPQRSAVEEAKLRISSAGWVMNIEGATAGREQGTLERQGAKLKFVLLTSADGAILATSAG